MIRVVVRPNESINNALRRFKKLLEKEGLNRDFKRKTYYEKPSEKRRRKILKSKQRRRREQQENENMA